jgi:hypothetical protein
MGGLARETRKVKNYAFSSIAISSDRGGCSPVAGESLHSNAEKHQVNLERRRGRVRGSVAAECFWTVSFPLPDTCRDVAALKRKPVTKAEPTATKSIPRNTADICLEEIL